MSRWILPTYVCLGLIAACGSTGSERNSSSAISADSSIIQDSTLRNETIGASVSEGMDAIEDSNGDVAATTLALHDDRSNWTRTCKEDGAKAVITLSATIDMSNSRSTRKIDFSRTVKGENSASRQWSYPGTDTKVLCASDGKHADIDWKSDITGLHLDSTFKRSREMTISRTVIKTDATSSNSVSFSAEGTRTVDWKSHKLSDDKTTFTRTKEIVSSATRKHVHANSKGESKEIEFTIATKDGANLVVEVVRDASTLEHKTKTLVSGTLVATRKGDGHVDTAFDHLVMDFTGTEECSMKSGSVTTSFYAEGSDKAEKSYKIVFTDGDATVTDAVTGDELTDVDLPDCNDYNLK